MDFSKINLEVLRTIPAAHKAAFVLLFLGIVGLVFYYYIVEPKNAVIYDLDRKIAKANKDVQTLTIKVKHLDELEAANKQLEIELAKKRERLPQKQEAVMLLKQVTDLGGRLGLDIQIWRPGPAAQHRSKLFIEMPVKVTVAGGYHTVALFFDRVSHLPRIINVSKLSMGSPKFKEGRAVIRTNFALTAFVAP